MTLRRTAWAVAMSVVVTLVALLAVRPPFPFAATQRYVDAAVFHVLGPQPQNYPDIIVIGLTEETLSAFPYRSPIDRAFLATLIDTLAAKGVRAIGLDVVLDRPSEPDKDARLRQALQRTDLPVIAVSVASDTNLTDGQRRFLAAFLQGVRTGDGNLARDRFDDTVRLHVPVNAVTGQLSFPAAIASALDAPVPDQPFPVEWRRTDLARRAGRDVTTYPAEQIALLPPSWMKGKIALIGSIIPGVDEHRTVASFFGQQSFGIDIHARVLSQLLDHQAVPMPALPWVEVALAAVLAFAGMILGSLWSASVSLTTMILLGCCFISFSLAFYAVSGVTVPLVSPTLALTLSGGIARAVRGMADRRERRALRALFSRFVSTAVVDEIMQHRDLFMAGGRSRPQQLTATVLYADAAGSTGICETLPPEPLIGWMDTYLETMTKVILAHHGIVLRFVGDGILAVFGAPIPRTDDDDITQDARNAAWCALDMERAMQHLNDRWARDGLPVTGLRIGLHTGALVAGTLGRGDHVEYCLLGDTANVGARLEQLGKDFAGVDPCACTIVVGEPTWNRLGHMMEGVRIGEIALRGRIAPMGAYRIDSRATGSVTRRLPPARPVPPDPR